MDKIFSFKGAANKKLIEEEQPTCVTNVQATELIAEVSNESSDSSSVDEDLAALR